MSFEPYDHSPPPFFRRGPSVVSRLLICVALALFLMVADARFNLMQPLRAVIAAVLYPAQWLALQPVQWARNGYGYLTDLKTAQKAEAAARARLVAQAQRAGQVEQLLQENERLRQLLALRARAHTPATAAQVLYDATDPYTRRVVIDKGSAQGIQPGSPVMDEAGVLGQVTRVYPFVSEITLVIDRNLAIPVINTRSGARSVAYGDPTPRSGLMELRYTFANEDVREGDLLATSGIDGIYPPGLPVARVLAVNRQGEATFMRVQCAPLAALQGVTHVMVLQPVQFEQPAPDGKTPPDAKAAAGAKAANNADKAQAAAQTASTPAPPRPAASPAQPAAVPASSRAARPAATSATSAAAPASSRAARPAATPAARPAAASAAPAAPAAAAAVPASSRAARPTATPAARPAALSAAQPAAQPAAAPATQPAGATP